MTIHTALHSTQNPGGLFAIEDMSLTTGSRFYVHATTGTDAAGYGTSPDSPVASLDYAIGLCTASKGDIIYLMPGHAETTTAIALDLIGVKVVGLGWGRNRPTLTATTGASNLIDVSVASVVLQNVRLVGAASGCTALLNLTAAGNDFLALNCSFEHGAAPLVAVTIAVNGTSAGAARWEIRGCTFLGTANGPDHAIELLSHCKDWIVSDCRFLYGAFGLDEAVIESAVDAQEGYMIEKVVVVGIDTLLVLIASSTAAPPDGFFANGDVMVSAPVSSTEIIVAAATSKGMAFGRVFAIDDTGKSGVRIPLVTAS